MVTIKNIRFTGNNFHIDFDKVIDECDIVRTRIDYSTISTNYEHRLTVLDIRSIAGFLQGYTGSKQSIDTLAKMVFKAASDFTFGNNL